MKDAMNRIRTSVGVVVTLGVLCLTGGCVAPPSGSPAEPYRPLARPMGGGDLLTVPVASPAIPPSETVTNIFSTADADIVGRTLRSGDRLLVTIHAPPEPFIAQHVVDEQGRINLPYIGTMPVVGKSCAQAQKDIEKEYIDQKFYKTVTVIIVPPESEYSVSGEVLRPGPYPLTRNLTVLQALSRAGRFTEYADKTKIKLIRGSDSVTINAEAITKGTQKDITIIPGDVIEVPKTWY